MSRLRRQWVDGKRECPTCKEWKPKEGFPLQSDCKDGTATYCIPCYALANRKYHIRRKYDLTVEQYDAIMAKGCAICGSESAHLDHDHKNGRIRAALCQGCNMGLGGFKDNPARLESAAEYIREWLSLHA